MAPATKKSSGNTANASSAVHPPYLQMISEAITSLKDRTGSSQPAIAKFMQEQYQTALPPNFKKVLSVQLKKFVKSEKLIKVKNSYKVSAAEKVKLLANTAKETQKTDVKKATGTEKSKAPKEVIAKKAVEKAGKTKRLSQVKTPEALKKKPRVQNVKSPAKGGKLKRLSQVETPDPLKKRKVATAGNIKMTARSTKSSKKKAEK